MDDLPPASAASGGERDTRDRDAQLVEAALTGDQRAFGQLYDAWFDRVFHLCLRIVRDREVAAEVAQDAFLNAWNGLSGLHDRDAFGGWLLRIARNKALNRSEKERRSTAFDDEGMAMIEASQASPAGAPAGFAVEDRLSAAADPARAAEDGEIVTLVHEAAATLGERDAEVLDLQLRFGMTPAEVGEVIGVNRNAANQLCHRIRKRFATAVQARVLWRGSRPACDELAALLASAGIDRFDSEAVKIADRHAPECDVCSERRELRLQPAALFASVPIVGAPVLLKQQAAAALEAAGVPMGGSAFAGGGVGPVASSGESTTAGEGTTEHSAAGAVEGSPARARRALLVGGTAIVALVVVLLAVLAVRAGDGGTDGELTIADADPTTTATPSSTTTTSIGIGTDTTLPNDVAPPASEPPTSPVPPPTTPPVTSPPPPTPTTPPPPAPTISLRLSPAQAGRTYLVEESSITPTLEWSVTDARSVRVEGWEAHAPALLSSAFAGSLIVCPGESEGTGVAVCRSVAGTYVYRLVVVGLDDQEHVETVTLTITP